MKHRAVFMGSAILAIWAAIPVSAGSDGAERGVQLAVISMSARMATLEETQKRLVANFRRLDVDGIPGVSVADVELKNSLDNARQRSRYISQSLSDDLNGDLIVTAEEIRPGVYARASQPLNMQGVQVPPTPEQIELIIQNEISKKLAGDLDGDGNLTLQEIVAAADKRIAKAAERARRSGNQFDRVADADGNGIVSEAEYRDQVARIFAAVDTDGDGRISQEERNTARRRILENRQPLATDGGAGQYTLARQGCRLPPAPAGARIAVVGGYDGAGLSDLYWGAKAEDTEVVDLRIGEEGAPVYLIASFNGATIMRIDDPAGRLAQVVYTKGEIGLVGAPQASLSKAPASCNLELWQKASAENPDPMAFFTDRLGRAPDVVVTDYTLGRVDLEAASNDNTSLLAGAAAAPAAETAAAAWSHFVRFNPGGMIPIAPETVRAGAPVSRHETWPQYAGLARLVADGTLISLPSTISENTVYEDDQGRIRIDGKVFVPGGGDDAILRGGLRYIEMRDKVWIGTEPPIFVVTKPFPIPAGLNGAHAVTFLVPDGVAEPTGARGHSKIRRLDRSQIVSRP